MSLYLNFERMCALRYDGFAHIYFQDVYNFDTFIANWKTNNYYASQTLNSKFYFLHNSPANFESYAKNHYAKLCKKGGIPPIRQYSVQVN